MNNSVGSLRSSYIATCSLFGISRYSLLLPQQHSENQDCISEKAFVYLAQPTSCSAILQDASQVGALGPSPRCLKNNDLLLCGIN